MPSLTMTDPRAFYYEPKHPLWSNGLDKSRFMILPKGAKIDTSVRDAWTFPVGTLFVKTFSYRDPGGKVIPIETRLIRRVADTGEVFEQWTFDVYEWDAGATGAKLIDIQITNGAPSDRGREDHCAQHPEVGGLLELPYR